MDRPTTILWLRRDLRLHDHPALVAAVDAARTGGGDPDANATLRTKIQKARDASVPKDNIENAIKRGTGELEGVQYEQLNYEGYAPNGVAVLVECLSDNRNRTASDVRSVFSKNGGNLAETGAVSFMFDHVGVVEFAPEAAGAESASEPTTTPPAHDWLDDLRMAGFIDVYAAAHWGLPHPFEGNQGPALALQRAGIGDLVAVDRVVVDGRDRQRQG